MTASAHAPQENCHERDAADDRTWRTVLLARGLPMHRTGAAGGGALGAYQAGVYEGLEEAGQHHARVEQCYLCHQTDARNDIRGVGWYKHH